MEDKYLYMIRQAQEFMNENHFADISLCIVIQKESPTRIPRISRILFVASNGNSHLVTQWKNSKGVKIREICEIISSFWPWLPLW